MQNLEIEMKETLITLTSDIVAAHLSNNNVDVEAVPGLITNVYNALSGLGEEAEVEEERPEPAVSIRASVKACSPKEPALQRVHVVEVVALPRFR